MINGEQSPETISGGSVWTLTSTPGRWSGTMTLNTITSTSSPPESTWRADSIMEKTSISARLA